MTLFEKIKKDQLEARKVKEAGKVSVLTTLIGEAGKLGKDEHGSDPTDLEVVATVKKFIKNLDDLLTHSPGNFSAIYEKAILDRYLPQQLTRLEIINIMTEANYNLKDNKIVGVVMGDFKKKYEGRYDAKLVTSILKELQAA